MKKKLNKKGFTLAELLIVVAIIAVLTAIAIPIFNTQLEKSREATDLANIRAAYAEQMTAYLEWDGTSTIANINVPVKQTQENWASQGDNEYATIAEGISGHGISVQYKTSGNYVVSIDEDGLVTVE